MQDFNARLRQAKVLRQRGNQGRVGFSVMRGSVNARRVFFRAGLLDLGFRRIGLDRDADFYHSPMMRIIHSPNKEKKKHRKSFIVNVLKKYYPQHLDKLIFML